MFSEATLRKLWPHGDSKIPGLIHGIAASAPIEFAGWRNVEIAQAMAQFSHECGAGTEMVENVHYSAERAAEVWPLRPNDPNANRHFANAADCYSKCDSFQGDPQFQRKLIDLVYGTRMGNRPGTDDGWNFIGRGLSQCTGREGYTKLATATGLDLLVHPELINSPSNALHCGVEDFILCGCLPYAKADDTLMVTKKLNGGTVGYEERKAWLVKWKKALVEEPPASVPVSKPPVKPVHTGTGTVATAGAAAAAGYLKTALVIIAVGAAITIGIYLWRKHKEG